MQDNSLSGSQLEKLGDRLRAGPLTLADLQRLRLFLETLEPFAEETFSAIQAPNRFNVEVRPAQVTRRNLKTIRSIVAKLRRQSTTLRQIQDLVGCRVIVPDIIDQEEWLAALASLFPGAQLVDRRDAPQHGYRAVHLIVRSDLKRFEVQLRTHLQDEWANLVEKLDDRLGLQLKYGLGPKRILEQLELLSGKIGRLEFAARKSLVRLQRTPHGSRGMRLAPLSVVVASEPRFHSLLLESPRRIFKTSTLLVGTGDADDCERATINGYLKGFGKVISANRPNPKPPYVYSIAFERGDEALTLYRQIWEPSVTLYAQIDETMKSLEVLSP